MHGTNHNLRFQNFLYNIISGRHSVTRLAELMCISTSTLYHWIEGESTFPVSMLAPLYNAVQKEGKHPGDALTLLNFILNDTDVMATSRQTAGNATTVLEETLDVVAAAGKVAVTVQAAVKNGRIDEAEKKEINEAINQDHKKLEELKRCVDSGCIYPLSTRNGNGKG